jgi:C4-dicarboxylate transporter, DctM subunit
MMGVAGLTLVSFAFLLLLLAVQMPIGAALGIVSIAGFTYLSSFSIAIRQLGTIPYQFAANWELTAIPMFLLMGAIVNHSGIAKDLFAAARLWMARLPGGLAVAANLASAGFGAASGSSIAASAAMARLAIPEMLRFGYDKRLAAGVVASAGTLAALIPPSVMFVVYGVFAEVSIVKLLMAGILPGLLTAAVYTGMIILRCKLDPSLAPPIEASAEEQRIMRWRETAKVWPLLLLMLGVIGGLYGGVFTPTEAGAGGAFIALLISIVQGRMGWREMYNSLKDAVSITAQIFFIGMGAIMFTRFLSLAGIGAYLSSTVGDWAVDPLLLVLAMSAVYLILGMFLDPLGIMLITIPVFLPMFRELGLDLVWLGVLIVKYIEIGLLTPPVGFQVYVVKGVVGDTISLNDIFRGCFWFLACEVVIMALLIFFPSISLVLPNSIF